MISLLLLLLLLFDRKKKATKNKFLPEKNFVKIEKKGKKKKGNHSK
jgi:hypothetical protein